MRINLITIGKVKEKYWLDAEKEYLKRLKSYADIKVVSLLNENYKLEINAIIKKEGQKIIAHLSKKSYIISLVIEGQELSSVEFSKKIEKLKTKGVSDITFIIGGSYGLSDEVKKLSDEKISFSKLTFPHQMFKIIFLEQLYRSFKIQEGSKYHK